jgi:hypothetical protein
MNCCDGWHAQRRARRDSNPSLLIRRRGQIVQDRPSSVVGWADIPELSTCAGRCPAAWLQSWLQLRLYRSGLCVDPDGHARCPGQLDGLGAAGAGASDERGAAVRSEGDHLGVAPVPGRSPVPGPVSGVCLGAVAGGPGGVGGSDRVSSARARAVDQQDALGVSAEDHRQGLLDGLHVVPGAAAGHQEPEGLAHDWSRPSCSAPGRTGSSRCGSSKPPRVCAAASWQAPAGICSTWMPERCQSRSRGLS